MPQTDLSEQVTCRKCHLSFVPSVLFDFYPDGQDPKVGLCERCVVNQALGVNDPTPLQPGQEVARCKFGQHKRTCSFLGVTGKGFQCLKGTAMETEIRKRREENSIKAKGDNCSGPPDFKPTLSPTE